MSAGEKLGIEKLQRKAEQRQQHKQEKAEERAQALSSTVRGIAEARRQNERRRSWRCAQLRQKTRTPGRQT